MKLATQARVTRSLCFISFIFLLLNCVSETRGQWCRYEQRTRVESYQVRTTSRCGFWGWRRCSKYFTAYRTATYAAQVCTACPEGQVWNENGSSCNATCPGSDLPCTQAFGPRCECSPERPVWHMNKCIPASECPASKVCPDGQIWNECGSACNSTCLNPNPICPAVCRPRCECPHDRPIWHNDQCVTLKECPAEKVCPDGQIWNECGSACNSTCLNPNPRCIAVCRERCQCPPDRPIWHNNQCVTFAECPACPDGQVFNDCGLGCNKTCDDPTPECSQICVPRCECPADKPILHLNKCIYPAECPKVAG